MWFKLKATSTNETCYDVIACAGRCRHPASAADLALGLAWRILAIV